MASDRLTLRHVLSGTGGELLGSAANELTFSSVSTDSRTIERSGLFVALRGQKHDGHDFVADAFSRRAAAALVERVPEGDVLADVSRGPALIRVPDSVEALGSLARYWLGRHPADVIGVAGSVGKSTAADLIASVLGVRCGVIRRSALERPEIFIPLAVLRIRKSVAKVVLEFDLTDEHQIERITKIVRPSMAVVTNVQPTHTNPEISLENLAQNLRLLVAAAPEDGSAVLNADDGPVKDMASATRATSIFYGLGPEAEVRAEEVVSRGVQGIEFDLRVAHRKVRVRLPLIGLNVLHSALAAAGAGLAAGLELRDIGAGLQLASAAPRIIVATGLNGSRVIDDSSNASLESNLDALKLLRELDGRKVAVLGDMQESPPYEPWEHRKVGNRAALIVDELVTLGERARLMADEARRLRLAGSAVYEASSKAEVIEYLRERLRPGDNVLVKGSREMAMEAIVQAIRLEG